MTVAEREVVLIRTRGLEAKNSRKNCGVANKKDILVIDEDLMVRQTLSCALEDDGFQAFPAADWQEAVFHFGIRHIHVLLMDAHLRFENARDTFDCSTALQPNLHVIAMTSRPTGEADDAGASRYNTLFEKPLDFPCPVATIRNSLVNPPRCPRMPFPHVSTDGGLQNSSHEIHPFLPPSSNR
jgi:CheY-like chemotaxis protein